MQNRSDNRAGWFLLITVCGLLVCGIVLATLGQDAQAKKYEYIGTYGLSDSATLAIHGGVSKYSLWPSKWTLAEKRYFEFFDGMKVNLYMNHTGDDWVMAHLFIAAGCTLRWDYSTQIGLTFGDTDPVHVSTEIVATDSPIQQVIYSNREGWLVFGPSSPYYQAGNGAYVIFLRYRKGSLGLDHEWSIERAKMAVPTRCQIWIERGRRHEDD